jgi:hypothetical protein
MDLLCHKILTQTLFAALKQKKNINPLLILKTMGRIYTPNWISYHRPIQAVLKCSNNQVIHVVLKSHSCLIHVVLKCSSASFIEPFYPGFLSACACSSTQTSFAAPWAPRSTTDKKKKQVSFGLDVLCPIEVRKSWMSNFLLIAQQETDKVAGQR